MGRSPVTRPSLLARLRDHRDGSAWGEFVDIYAPLVFAYGRRHRLRDADASDLVQDVLRAVAAATGRFTYDPTRGSFRGWLLTITRNELRRLLRRESRQPAGAGGTDALLRMAEHSDDDDTWERWHRERLFSWAAERVRGSFRTATWDAFWRTAVENRPAEDVAREVGLSVGAVYIARSRVLARLRSEIAAVEGDGPPARPVDGVRRKPA